MTGRDTAQDSEIGRLQAENRELRGMVSRLVEAASQSGDRDMTWVLALEGSRDGVWDWNARTGEVYFSPRWKEMLGYADDEISGNLSEWERRVHPDDMPQVRADLEAHLSGRVPYYQNEHRVLCRDGGWKWILDRGRIVSWDEAGRPLRIVGTHTDVSARKEAELEQQRLLAELRDADGRIRILSGLLPVCAGCRQIREEDGSWHSLEDYVRRHSPAEFSHGLCPQCARRLYPDIYPPA